jgi:hypothetical protein
MPKKPPTEIQSKNEGLKWKLKKSWTLLHRNRPVTQRNKRRYAMTMKKMILKQQLEMKKNYGTDVHAVECRWNCHGTDVHAVECP